jgi:hypothetical protein
VVASHVHGQWLHVMQHAHPRLRRR